MPRTLYHFGKSEELISNDNPKGIFDVCKECRKDDNTINSKIIEFAKCPKCGKIASEKEQVEQLFGFRMMNDKKIVQSQCKKCR